MDPQPADNNALQILHLEDSALDAELIGEHLADISASVHIDWAANKHEYESFLLKSQYGLILVDYSLPGYDAPTALRRAQTVCPDVPFICISGAIGEDAAVQLLRQGATDYVRKDRLDVLVLTVRRALAEAHDRKARLKAEADLVKAKEAAEAANSAKDRFMAMLSHELRTPLTPVVAILSVLDSDPRVPAELREDITLMRRSVELEARLVDDLLDLTRIRHGKLRLTPRVIDGHDVLRQAIAIVHGPLDAKGLTLRVSLSAGHAVLSADPARFEQICWNMLSNAIKFTPERGVITVESENIDGQLVIRVRDTGRGLSPAVLKRIFTAFEQGNDDTGPRLGGLGLGLAISRQLAEMHGATITAASEGPGKGATFTLSIPTIADAVPAAQPPPAAAPCEDAALRILLVEDDPTTRSVLSRLLRRGGHVVVTAGTVREGIDLAAKGEFDLLLSDIGLPDGSGLDVMRQAHARFPRGGIALSGFGTDRDVECSLAAGFRMHITKPVDMARLREAICEVAGTREQSAPQPSRGTVVWPLATP